MRACQDSTTIGRKNIWRYSVGTPSSNFLLTNIQMPTFHRTTQGRAEEGRVKFTKLASAIDHVERQASTKMQQHLPNYKEKQTTIQRGTQITRNLYKCGPCNTVPKKWNGQGPGVPAVLTQDTKAGFSAGQNSKRNTSSGLPLRSRMSGRKAHQMLANSASCNASNIMLTRGRTAKCLLTNGKGGKRTLACHFA